MRLVCVGLLCEKASKFCYSFDCGIFELLTRVQFQVAECLTPLHNLTMSKIGFQKREVWIIGTKCKISFQDLRVYMKSLS